MAKIIYPLSRIEGHAQVVIDMRAGSVSARFKAMEFRGFEKFMTGVPSEQIPVIVSRLCGVCSTAHHVTAIKALEDVFGVEPPPIAKKIRELMLLGQLIQNQATSLFLMSMPDRLGSESIFLMEGDSDQKKQMAEITAKALHVRKAGTNLIALAGGQCIHPVRAVVGGVSSGIPEAKAAAMLTEIESAIPVACKLVDHYWELSLNLRERIGTWGDDEPSFYITSTSSQRPSLDNDTLYILNPDGAVCESFPPKDFRKHLTFEESDYSYASKTSYNGSIIRANSLARMNSTAAFSTPHADSYRARFQESFGIPSHAILLYDLARGIELVYALERTIELLQQPLDNADTDVPYTPRDGDGYGLVEAPRGPLIHYYRIENNCISAVKYIIPTVHNMLAIERALGVAARRYIHDGKIDLELEHAVGRVVRAFDPCIACATH